MMEKIKKSKIVLFFALVCVSFICGGCAEKEIKAPSMNSVRSAWVVYWDWENGKNEASSSHYHDLVAFAVNFDVDAGLLYPSQIAPKDLQESAEKHLYLSFVNDIKTENGDYLHKDIKFLAGLLRDEKARTKHVNDVIAICKEKGFTGIEIDYENIWKDKGLVKNFADFIKKLHKESKRHNLKLRVVLETRSLEYAEIFPDEIEYVVMFYNLYGIHTGPGPKANEAFIVNTLKKMQKLEGIPNIAFAKGGFVWENGTVTKSLTAKQAGYLAEKFSVEPKRCVDSQALYFDYLHEGKKYTVWYADAKTIEFWRDIARKYGYKRFSLWRLDGDI